MGVKSACRPAHLPLQRLQYLLQRNPCPLLEPSQMPQSSSRARLATWGAWCVECWLTQCTVETLQGPAGSEYAARWQVVEQLLRAVPGIKKVYVIVRSKWGMSGEQSAATACRPTSRRGNLWAIAEGVMVLTGKQRMDRQLQRSMWHLHRHNGTIVSEVRAKLSVLEGDLLQKGCGLSAPEQRRLGREVDYVIHCAASISFSEHIHTLLAHNYQVSNHRPQLLSLRSGKPTYIIWAACMVASAGRPHLWTECCVRRQPATWQTCRGRLASCGPLCTSRPRTQTANSRGAATWRSGCTPWIGGAAGTAAATLLTPSPPSCRACQRAPHHSWCASTAC